VPVKRKIRNGQKRKRLGSVMLKQRRELVPFLAPNFGKMNGGGTVGGTRMTQNTGKQSSNSLGISMNETLGTILMPYGNVHSGTVANDLVSPSKILTECSKNRVESARFVDALRLEHRMNG